MTTFRDCFIKLKHNYTPEQKQEIISFWLERYKQQYGTKDKRKYESFKELLTDYVCYCPPLKEIKADAPIPAFNVFKEIGAPKDNETV